MPSTTHCLGSASKCLSLTSRLRSIERRNGSGDPRANELTRDARVCRRASIASCASSCPGTSAHASATFSESLSRCAVDSASRHHRVRRSTTRSNAVRHPDTSPASYPNRAPQRRPRRRDSGGAGRIRRIQLRRSRRGQLGVWNAVLALHHAARMRGWRPRSLGLLRAAMHHRRLS